MLQVVEGFLGALFKNVPVLVSQDPKLRRIYVMFLLGLYSEILNSSNRLDE